MVGYSFLNKKDFHPGSFANIEKVYLAEQRAQEKKRNEEERLKRLKEEMFEEEMRKIKVEQGLLPPSVVDKMDWMYNQKEDKNIGEEYLLGKPVEEQFLEKKKEQVFQEEKSNPKNEQFLRFFEDPLFQVKKKQLQMIKKGNDGIQREKKIKKEDTKKVIEEYHSKYMGKHVKLDLKGKKLVMPKYRKNNQQLHQDINHQ